MIQALTHPSVGGAHFQRLEFLGDRALGLVMSEWLCKLYPEEPEGALAKRFAQLVKWQTLYQVSLSLNLLQHLKADATALSSPKALADTCEALIGAIYLDGGLCALTPLIHAWWQPFISQAAPPPIDAKSALQEYLQGHKFDLPSYEIVSQEGPSHQPSFVVRLSTKQGTVFWGRGGSRREAEQEAARAALFSYTSSGDDLS